MNAPTKSDRRLVTPTLFRIGLFAVALSLAAYIPYKYATELHAITGLYAFLFPFSAVLAVAGIVLALRPKSACDCTTMTRVGMGGVAVLWLATGVMCGGSLAQSVAAAPVSGLFATFHMAVQHIFLSASVFAFALAPHWMARKLGVQVPSHPARDVANQGKLAPGNL